MKLLPNENVIIGQWVRHDGKVIGDDNSQRIEWLTKYQLKKVSTTDGGWTTIYQDIHDGRYWQHSYPQSELHGGGPPMLEHITQATLAYQKIKNSLNFYLGNIGYEKIDEQYHSEVFGSDKWFLLQVSTELPINNNSLWVEIQCNPYDINERDSDQINKIAENMLDSVIKHKWGKLS
jgi:hypothetical protein